MTDVHLNFNTFDWDNTLTPLTAAESSFDKSQKQIQQIMTGFDMNREMYFKCYDHTIMDKSTSNTTMKSTALDVGLVDIKIIALSYKLVPRDIPPLTISSRTYL